MSDTSSLPPSGRDFRVFQRIVVDRASTRTAALEADVSQTRVRQIVRRVIDWLAATLPNDPEINDAARLRVGQHIAADRLETLVCETMREWSETKQPKFAGLASRLINAQAKIPAFPGTLEALAADAIEGPLPDNLDELFTNCAVQPSQPTSEIGAPAPAGHLKSEIPSSPLPADCSPSPPPLPKATVHPPRDSAATPLPETPSSHLPPTTRAARSAFFAPAHLSENPADEAPVAELKTTPTEIGFSTKPRLTRRERRRRRLALAK